MTEQPAANDGFDVRLHRSGRTVVVPPGESILNMLLDAGVNVAFSCTEGFCGTCATGVIDGIPDHQDSFLTDEEKAENSKIMICCSRSKSPVLTLDL
jgi:tetrachlorobenzoquinone reductase